MTIPRESLTAASERLVATAAESESAPSLILTAVGWLVLAEGLSAFVKALMSKPGAPNASWDTLAIFTAQMIMLDGVLLITVRKRSRIVGYGNRCAGVDDRPIMRWRLLIVLVLLAATWAFFASAVFVWAVRNAPEPQWVASWRQASPWTVAAFAVAAVVLAPLAEELFFRGWLWTALRRRWRAFPTALLTCGFWMVVHLERGLLLPLFLLPIAVILGFARHFCGIRAAIILHAIYNLVGILGLLPLLVSRA